MGPNRTGIDQFQLRLPSGLRERIKSRAEAHGRSMNTEIVVCLEQSLSGEGLSEEAQETIRRLREDISRLEGMNEALGRTVKAFVDHLSVSDEGKQLILKKILEDEFVRIPAKEGE
ncbi:Arc family DNA-binding protein [Shinella pollutisoli]|uniref:Arc family DNA-binding protein n=1 Tax=Shinella pollutisoli TaxID=2250594 RepID=A0ABV7DMX0_9HYPH|nr:Arc family DNA-binding protein [Shinella pollutisoli]